MMPKEIRLKLEKDIKHAARGSVVYSKALILRFVRTRNDHSRFVVVTSAKVSKKAVVRNLIRRRLSAILTKAEPLLLTKVDGVISVKNLAKDLTYNDLRIEIWTLLTKARLMSSSLLSKK